MDENLSEMKLILETALLVSHEPVSMHQLEKLFDPAVDSESLRTLLEARRRRPTRAAT